MTFVRWTFTGSCPAALIHLASVSKSFSAFLTASVHVFPLNRCHTPLVSSLNNELNKLTYVHFTLSESHDCNLYKIIFLPGAKGGSI